MYLIFDLVDSLYLIVDAPKRAEIPVRSWAYIYRKGWDIIVETELGEWTIGQDLTVSRRFNGRKGHAHIFFDSIDGKYFVKDLGSTNGTQVDGRILPGWSKRIESEDYPLMPGSSLILGYGTIVMVEGSMDEMTVPAGSVIRMSKETAGLIKDKIPNAKTSIMEDIAILRFPNEPGTFKVEDRRNLKLIEKPEAKLKNTLITQNLFLQELKIHLISNNIDGVVSTLSVYPSIFKELNEEFFDERILSEFYRHCDVVYNTGKRYLYDVIIVKRIKSLIDSMITTIKTKILL